MNKIIKEKNEIFNNNTNNNNNNNNTLNNNTMIPFFNTYYSNPYTYNYNYPYTPVNYNSKFMINNNNNNNNNNNEVEDIINNEELECMPEIDCSNSNVDITTNQPKLVIDDKNKRKSKVNNIKNYRNIVVKDTIYANKLTIQSQIQLQPIINNITPEIHVNIHEIICSNCGKSGHKFKNCSLAVVSYGLICFHKKKIMIPDKSMNHDYFNKRTKKYEDNNKTTGTHGTQGTQGTQPQIRILKRNEQPVQSSSVGITNSNNRNLQNSVLENQEETLDNIIQIDDDIPEPLDNCNNKGNNKNNVNEPIKMKEIYSNKVILIQRRNTIGFIEFLRGKYDVTNFDYIVKLFNMMTFDEKRTLREYDSFDTIRLIIGLKRESVYKTEYDEAKVKFTTLQKHNDGNMIHKLLDKSYTRWTTPEWGLPKGRKGRKEFEIECAVREFSEETGIKYKNICVYRNVKPLEEIYKGINGVIYKHVYYLASIKETEDAIKNMDIVEQGGLINFEVSNVKLFSLNECHKIIRPYYISKLNAIKKGFQLINSLGHFFE